MSTRPDSPSNSANNNNNNIGTHGNIIDRSEYTRGHFRSFTSSSDQPLMSDMPDDPDNNTVATTVPPSPVVPPRSPLRLWRTRSGGGGEGATAATGTGNDINVAQNVMQERENDENDYSRPILTVCYSSVIFGRRSVG